MNPTDSKLMCIMPTLMLAFIFIVSQQFQTSVPRTSDIDFYSKVYVPL